MNIIETHELTKTFKKAPAVPPHLRQRIRNSVLKKQDKIVAVDKLSLKIKRGEIFGLIGPNGAGKTTFIKLLSTLILPDSGTATIDGHDLVTEERIVRTKIGVMTGEHSRSLYWRLTGKQNLKFFARLYDIENEDKKIRELLDLTDLTEWQNELVMKYSSGMQHKLALARTLLNDPPILLLDEPTTGIDAKARYEIRRFIEKLESKTILWTSHDLYEIEEICDRVAMIDHGQLLFEARPDELKKQYSGYRKLEVVLDSPCADIFSGLRNANIKDEYTAEILVDDINSTLEDINKIVNEKKITVESFTTVFPSLEEIFVRILSEDDKKSPERDEKRKNRSSLS